MRDRIGIIKTVILCLFAIVCLGIIVGATESTKNTEAGTEPPTIIAPENNTWINKKKPTIKWDFSNQATFHIQVGSNTNWSNGAEKWNNVSNASEQEVVYSGSGLDTEVDYPPYYWRLKCKNTAGDWSDWSETYNFRGDTRGPGNWNNPGIKGNSTTNWVGKNSWVNETTVDCRLGTVDRGSGINTSAGGYAISTNNGNTWSPFYPYNCDGNQREGWMYAWGLEYGRDSKNKCGRPLRLWFRVVDNVGNVGDYNVWYVKIDSLQHKLSGVTEDGWYNSTDITPHEDVWFISNVTVNLTKPLAFSNNYNYTNYSIDNGSWIKCNVTEDPGFTITDDGIHTLEYYHVNTKSNKYFPARPWTIKIDKTPPTTTQSLSGTLGSNDWYVSDVTVTLIAADNTSGINKTYYKVDNGSWLEGKALTLTQDGSHTVYYYSTDLAENVETENSVSVKIDQTPPITTYSLSGNEGMSNWFRSNVQITLTSSDEPSGTNYTKYKINDGYWQTGTTFTLGDEMQYTIYYYSTDYAGNHEPEKSFAVGIDKTKPEIYSIEIDSDNAYTNKTEVQLSLSAYDSLSGLWQMQLKNDDTSWSNWIDWSNETSWELSSGDGEKTVYISMICPKCEYEWIPRTKDPKECPRCKIRLDYPYKQ